MCGHQKRLALGVLLVTDCLTSSFSRFQLLSTSKRGRWSPVLAGPKAQVPQDRVRVVPDDVPDEEVPHRELGADHPERVDALHKTLDNPTV